jgi:predicted outer membrane repeat protein
LFLRPHDRPEEAAFHLFPEQAAQSHCGGGFAGRAGIEVDSAGLNHDAEVPLSAEQIEWADLILVMENTAGQRGGAVYNEGTSQFSLPMAG